MRRTLNRLQDAAQIIAPLLFALAIASYMLDTLDQSAFGQNVEGQIIASQYGQWQLQGTQTNSFTFSPAACQVKGGNKNFSALKQGTSVRIVDPGESAIDETLIAGLVNIHACSVQLLPVNVHNPPFYLTSGTAGLQEAIDANQTTNGPNSIILSADWYEEGGSAAIIASVTGIPTLSLVDITTTPYTWYEWNGSHYAAVPVGGGSSPGGLIGAFQYNSGGAFAGSVINGIVKGNGTSAPSAAVPGTDYEAPLGYTAADVANNLSDLASASTARTNLELGTSPQLAEILNTSPSTKLSAALIPTLNQNTTGNAATATALASSPFQCPGSLFATGIGPGGDANCAAPGTGVPSVNGVSSAVTMAASGTGLSVSTVGGVVTYSLTGGAGTGGVGSAAQYACGQYPATGTTIGGAANCFILPVGLDTSQINTFLSSLTNADTVILQSGDAPTPFTNTNKVHIVDFRVDVPVETRSLKEWGAQCDTRSVRGTLSGTSFTVDDDSATQADVGKTFVAVGVDGGIPTAIEFTVVSVSGSVETLNHASPFAISTGQQFTLGHDDTAAIDNALTAQLFAGGLYNISLSIPVGKCLTHSQVGQSPGDLVGYSQTLSQIVSYPGESVFTIEGGSLQHYSNFGVMLDNRIDPTQPWQYIDASNTTHSVSAVYQPIMPLTAEANNPLAPGWFQGSVNGVATVTSGSTAITFTSSAVPATGSTIVFPYLSSVFTATVTVSGTSGTLSASYPGTTGTKQEWFAGASVQTIQTDIPATGRTYPLSVTLANSIAPNPAGESNVSGHGVVKIDGEECSYLNITKVSPYTIALQACGLNGTSAAHHAVGATIVPLNPFLFDAAPWPVTPTLTSGSTTPANASFYPAYNVGQFAFGAPCYDGNEGCNAGPQQATWDHVSVGEWPAAGNFGPVNDAAFYWVGLPYASHFNDLVLANQYCFVEGVSSINSHGYGSSFPTADGMTTNDISCHASTYGMVADIIAGGEMGFSNWNSYGGGGGSPPAESGAGFNVTNGYDDETGALFQLASASHFDNIYLEPGGTSYGVGAGMELDCATCTWTNLVYSGGAGDVYIGSGSQRFIGGYLAGNSTTPILNYGSATVLDGTLGIGGGPQGDTYRSSSFVNWGYSLSGCVPISGSGLSPCINPGVGSTERQSNGQSSETFATGNITTPYVDPITGFIKPEEFDTSTSSFPYAGKAIDATAPITGSYIACNSNSSYGCLSDFFGGQLIGIGPGQRLVPGKYVPTVAIRSTAGSATALFYLQAAYCGNTQFYLQEIAVTSTWQTLQLPVTDMSSYSGCDLAIGIGSSNTTQIQLAFVDFSPLAQNIQAQQFTLPNGGTITGGATAPSGACTGSSLYLNSGGAPNTLYVCQSGAWVGK